MLRRHSIQSIFIGFYRANRRMSNEPELATCPCAHCGGLIEFETSRVRENVTCPHCNAETTLFVPPVAEPEATPTPAPPSIEEIKQAGIERRILKITEIKSMLRARLESGTPVFLYDSVFVPVDSQILDEEFASEFDVSILRKLGLLGWEIVQAVPRTKGIGLENIGTDTLFGSKWAGGVGGNVMGVHIIIKKLCQPATLPTIQPMKWEILSATI